MILLITNTKDAHADAIADTLNKRNVDFFRLNMDELRYGKLGIYLSNEDRNKSIIWHKDTGREITFDALKCIFYRRGNIPYWSTPVKDSDSNPEIEEFTRSEIEQVLWNLVYIFSDKLIADPFTPFTWPRFAQYNLAKQFEVPVPQAIITNNISHLNQFAERHTKLVIKPLSPLDPSLNGKNQYLFTAEFDPTTIAPSDLEPCPSYIMQKIDKVSDIRAVVVEDQIFAVEMKQTTKSGMHVDFRATDVYSMENSIFEFEKEFADKVIRLCQAFGQAIGHFDFAKTSSGDLVFFENNLNGQWLWLEDTTHIRITEPIVDLLLNFAGKNAIPA